MLRPGSLPHALALAGALAGVTGARAAGAQGPPRARPVIGLSAGFSPHVFDGAGTGVVVMLHLEVPQHRLFLLEPAAGYYRYVPADGAIREYYLIEGGMQGQLPLGPVRPFAGIGVGVAEPGGTGAALATRVVTWHGATGLRLDITSGWVVRTELRWRALFGEGYTFDATVGIGRRL